MIRRFLYIALLWVWAPTATVADEIEGFRLGMSTQEVNQLAAEKNYRFSNPMKEQGSNWVSYVLMKDGPNISLCGDTLSALSKTYSSNLHELTNLLNQWTTNLGSLETSTKQFFSNGIPFSSVMFRWTGLDNVRRDISISQYGQDDLTINYGFSYIDHPCRPHP